VEVQHASADVEAQDTHIPRVLQRSDTLFHMLAFIYLAYQMMTSLYETVPAFRDLYLRSSDSPGRYRMAIEDEEISDRET
jgi:hypothetical protein